MIPGITSAVGIKFFFTIPFFVGVVVGAFLSRTPGAREMFSRFIGGIGR